MSLVLVSEYSWNGSTVQRTSVLQSQAPGLLYDKNLRGCDVILTRPGRLSMVSPRVMHSCCTRHLRNVCLRATGLLTSGLIPVVRHSLLNLLTSDAVIIPASATVFFQVTSLTCCALHVLMLLGSYFAFQLRSKLPSLLPFPSTGRTIGAEGGCWFSWMVCV